MKDKNPTVIKPWGKYEILEKHDDYWIKKLFVHQGEALSLQKHQYRAENWVVLYGKVGVTKGSNKLELNTGETIKIEKNEVHRLAGITDSCVLEIAFGKVLEEDIIRLEDNYGRAE